MTFSFKLLATNLLLKYNKFHEFCFYILYKTPNLYPIQRGKTRRRHFDAKTIIKMKVGDIKTKSMIIAIF